MQQNCPWLALLSCAGASPNPKHPNLEIMQKQNLCPVPLSFAACFLAFASACMRACLPARMQLLHSLPKGSNVVPFWVVYYNP